MPIIVHPARALRKGDWAERAHRYGFTLLLPALATRFLIPPLRRAIALGLTPALKAARTAFSLPVVNKPVTSLATASARGRGFAWAVSFSFVGLDSSRPRRSASAVTAASKASISALSNRFRASTRSLGKKWRDCEAALSASPLRCGMAECSGRLAWYQLWRRQISEATASCRSAADISLEAATFTCLGDRKASHSTKTRHRGRAVGRERSGRAPRNECERHSISAFAQPRAGPSRRPSPPHRTSRRRTDRYSLDVSSPVEITD